jgi:hypothetical protein
VLICAESTGGGRAGHGQSCCRCDGFHPGLAGIVGIRYELRMAFPSSSPGVLSRSSEMIPMPRSRAYRLVDARGEPHPVLDDHYDSQESAWSEAVDWWETQPHGSREPIGIGVEVSTINGEWRTIRYPCA